MGGHPVSAVYSGDSNDLTSTSPPVNQVVNPYNTSVALTVRAPPPVFGEKVTLRATVSVLPPGTGPATGSVTFFDGSTAPGLGDPCGRRGLTSGAFHDSGAGLCDGCVFGQCHRCDIDVCWCERVGWR